MTSTASPASRRKSRNGARSALLDGTLQRISGAIVQAPDLFPAEPRLFDQEVSARQHRGGQPLDDETHGFGGCFEPRVLGPALGGPAAIQEQLRRGAVIEAREIARLLPRVLADPIVRLGLARHAVLLTPLSQLWGSPSAARAEIPELRSLFRCRRGKAHGAEPRPAPPRRPRATAEIFPAACFPTYRRRTHAGRCWRPT